MSLWQVRKFYELAHQKAQVVVCDSKIGTSIVHPKKNLSYGLYQVFYTNYLTLVKPYLLNGTINENGFNRIEKDLFFDFFMQWVINWEMNKGEMFYSKSENLKDAVFNKCKGRPYWNEFYKLYRRKYYMAKIKKFINRTLYGEKHPHWSNFPDSNTREIHAIKPDNFSILSHIDYLR